MLKKNTPKEYVQLAIAALAMMYLGYFASLELNDHIIRATQCSFAPLSKLYLKYFSKIDSDTYINGHTPIDYAITNSTPLNAEKIKKLKPIVDIFMKRGVDINASNSFGLTSIHYAIMNEDPAAVQFLVDQKANVNQPVKIEGMDQQIQPSQIAGMTPLRFLEERKHAKLVKNMEKIKEIETILNLAGANNGKEPQFISGLKDPKQTPAKPKKKK